MPLGMNRLKARMPLAKRKTLRRLNKPFTAVSIFIGVHNCSFHTQFIPNGIFKCLLFIWGSPCHATRGRKLFSQLFQYGGLSLFWQGFILTRASRGVVRLRICIRICFCFHFTAAAQMTQTRRLIILVTTFPRGILHCWGILGGILPFPIHFV